MLVYCADILADNLELGCRWEHVAGVREVNLMSNGRSCNRKYLFVVLGIVGAGALGFAVGSIGKQPISTQENELAWEWVREHASDGAVIVDSSSAVHVYDVADTRVDEAIGLLLTNSWVALSRREIHDLAKYRVPEAPAGHKPYLVRSVCGAPGTGRVEVGIDDTTRHFASVFVERARLTSIRRMPLIVFLKEPPKDMLIQVAGGA